jgi:NADH dehydrogenase
VPSSLFLTGASGYLGRHLLSRMGSAHFQKVYCLTHNAHLDSPAPNVVTVRGNLLDPSSYSTSLAESDTVVHLAAVTGKQPRSEYFRVNRDGTAALLQASRSAGVRRVVYISSIAAGFRDQTRYYYAQSKSQAEELVARSGLEYVIIRPTIIMGPGAPVLESLSKLAAAPVVPVFGDGNAQVQPVSVYDLATCLLDILQSGNFGNRVIEIGGPEAMTIQEMLLAIRRIRYGKPARVVHVPAGPVATILGILEKALLPLLPLTAGQVASFTNDGTAQTSSGTYIPRETLREILQRS